MKNQNNIKKIAKAEYSKLMAALSNEMDVYLPVVGNDGQSRFEPWADGKQLANTVNTVRSAKDFFFPQTENIVGFKLEGKNIEIVDIRDEARDFAVFGVRACDAKSFEILDRVFLADPVDTFYKSRREHGVIVTAACSEAEDTCFCTTFGIDPAEPCGDVTTWTVGDEVFLRSNTEKGEKLLASVASLLTDANAKDGGAIEAEKERISKMMAELPLASLNTEKFDGRDLMQTFKSDKWKDLSATCLGCGTCTFVCPTCQCYDIREFDTGNGVKRFRCWDSCMYSDFTKMAAENPRHTQLERFRQRFMHKLIYFPQNNDGVYGCVGCGRCLAKCPISMNIVKVMKSIGEEK